MKNHLPAAQRHAHFIMTDLPSHGDRWRALWRRIGVQTPDEALLLDLTRRYAEPHRRYHTMQHLDECFAHFDSVRHTAAHPDEIELALWFHDAVYDVKRHDNEQQSADWAQSVLRAAGVSGTTGDRVYALIMATRHRVQPQTLDEQILVDVDLSILGAESMRFDEYERQVRAEYDWVADDVFRQKRALILREFLARDSVYSTAHFIENLEERARRNLEQSLTRLAD
jgi:predicted metal-dependent HD superfamily phosphohydrolase